jgi:hypothetical protein
MKPNADILPESYRAARKPDGSMGASLRCPKCRGWMTILHEIDKTGLITPSVVCPLPNVECPNSRCDWHESGVRLIDWPNGKGVR